MSGAPIYIDWILTVVLMIAAAIQYLWIGFHGHSMGRWLQAVGYTGLALRIGWTLSIGEDPPIASVSIPLLTFIAAGSSITAIQQMRLLWMDVRCLQDHSQPCYRQDRVRAAFLEKRK